MFEKYQQIRKSNLALFKALARRAKLAIKALEKNVSAKKTAKMYEILIRNEQSETPPIKIQDNDVLNFIDAATTKIEKRKEIKDFYLKIINILK